MNARWWLDLDAGVLHALVRNCVANFRALSRRRQIAFNRQFVAFWVTQKLPEARRQLNHIERARAQAARLWVLGGPYPPYQAADATYHADVPTARWAVRFFEELQRSPLQRLQWTRYVQSQGM